MAGRKKLGIALGGGGSRAFLHLGVLSRLAEAGIHPDCLSGSSMGAVLGALYAADPDPVRSIPKILDYFRRSKLFGGLPKPARSDGLHHRPGLIGAAMRKCATASVALAVSFRMGLLRRHPVNRAIDEFFPGESLALSGLALPFGLNALDLSEGTVRSYTDGPLNPLLKAGVAIGLVFKPFHWNGRDYADAAPLCPVPAGLCRRLGADVVLAMDICAPLERNVVLRSGFDVARRILAVQSDELNRIELGAADLVVKADVSDVFWGDFTRIDEVFARGRAAAESALPKLESLGFPPSGDGTVRKDDGKPSS